MRFESTPLLDLYVVSAEPRSDFRGSFTELWNRRDWETAGIHFQVDQVNVSESLRRGTVRGMHYQEAPAAQKKLVRCLRGEVFDAAVDVRPLSPSYGKWFGLKLSEEETRALYIPHGFAHGWQALVPGSAIEYLVDGLWSREHERGVSPLNRHVDIRWPLKVKHVIDRDLAWPALGAM